MTAAVAVGSFSSSSVMAGLKVSSLLARFTVAGRRRWGGRVLGQGATADVQMAGDFAQRPLLGPVEAVNDVDLFRCEHRADSFIPAVAGREPERCSFQDPVVAGGTAASN